MVEGPGCTRNGQKVRALLGKRVAGVAGSASSCVAGALRGCTLVDAITLGKQLWLIVTNAEGRVSGVRCHFGMNGSLHCNSQPDHAGALTLFVRFHDGSELRLFQSTVAPADAQAALREVQDSCNRDICAAAFDELATVAALSSARTSQMVVSDALLDQSVVPGVGNIIKNEALHEACVDPRILTGSLSAEKLLRLVRAARAFSASWCRNGRQPPCKIYNRAHCSDCGGSVALCKLGSHGAPRPTFWCSARVSVGTCGKRAAEPNAAEPRAKKQRKSSELAPPTNALANPWTLAAAPPPPAPLLHAPAAAAATAPAAPPLVAASSLPVSVAQRRGPGRVCSLHGPGRITLRRVRKAGLTAGRLFLGCREKACSHFVWADTSFPSCACAQLAGLRISKQASSGGRWFFGCRGEAKQRCNFFQWAAPEVAQGFDGLLTPLT